MDEMSERISRVRPAIKPIGLVFFRRGVSWPCGRSDLGCQKGQIQNI